MFRRGSLPDLHHRYADGPQPFALAAPRPPQPYLFPAHGREQIPDQFNGRVSTSIPKPEPYDPSKNFTRFCQRFLQYISLSNLRNNNLHYMLLGMVDDITYAKLCKVPLTDEEKAIPELFCRKFERAIYPPSESKALRSELAMVKQGANETVGQFAFRISEMALKAYPHAALRDEASYTAFIQGLYDIALKTKVLESDVDNFDEALQYAERLERVARSVKSSNLTEPAAVFAVGSSTSSVSREDDSTWVEASHGSYHAEQDSGNFSNYHPSHSHPRFW